MREAVDALLEWMNQHPQSTPEEFEFVSARIAKRHRTTAWILSMACVIEADRRNTRGRDPQSCA